jgi:hypothetical protein
MFTLLGRVATTDVLVASMPQFTTIKNVDGWFTTRSVVRLAVTLTTGTAKWKQQRLSIWPVAGSEHGAAACLLTLEHAQ